MQQDGVTLARVFEGRGAHQDPLAGAVAPLTPEQLGPRVAPSPRSIGELAAHLVRTRVGWFTQALHVEAPDLAPLAGWGRLGVSTFRSGEELADGFAASWRMIERSLAQWTTTDLDEVVRATRQDECYEFTRKWVLWHVAEHDLHHGGELSLTLGINGLAAPAI
jgi:uncharacterized damage-inducible protein DinB